MILTSTKLENYSSLASVSTSLATASLVLSVITSLYMAKKENIKLALTAIISPLVGLVIILVWGVVNMMQLSIDCNNLNPQFREFCSQKALELNHLPIAMMLIAIIVIGVNIVCILSCRKSKR